MGLVEDKITVLSKSLAGESTPITADVNHLYDMNAKYYERMAASGIWYVYPGQSLQAAVDAAVAAGANLSNRHTVIFDESKILLRSDVVGESVDCTFDVSANDAIDATAHGLSAGDRIRFDDVAGVTELNTYTQYFVINPAADSFQVSTTYGGSKVTLTTAPTGAGVYRKLTPFVVPDGIDLVPMHPSRWEPKARSPKHHKINMARKAIITLTFDDFKSGAPDGATPTQMTALGFTTGWQYLRYLGIGPTFAMNCDETSRTEQGDRETLQDAARIMWALGGDIMSHGYLSHNIANDPYDASYSDDEIIARLETELRESKRFLESWQQTTLGVTTSSVLQPVIGWVPGWVQPGGNTWNWDAALYDNTADWRRKLQASYAKIIQNEYEFARLYGSVQSPGTINSVDNYWQGYFEIVSEAVTPEAQIKLMIDKAVAEGGVLDLMTHKMTQQVANILEYIVALRAAGSCEIMSYVKARYTEFVGTTANAYIYGGRFEKFAAGALSSGTWYNLASGATAYTDKLGAGVTVRPTNTNNGTATIVDVSGEKYLELAGATSSDLSLIQISNSNIKIGQNTIRFELIVPAGKTGTFRLTHNHYGTNPNTHAFEGWALAHQVSGTYDAYTALPPGTYTIVRQMIVRPNDTNIQYKIELTGHADNAVQIGKIEWF